MTVEETPAQKPVVNNAENQKGRGQSKNPQQAEKAVTAADKPAPQKTPEERIAAQQARRRANQQNAQNDETPAEAKLAQGQKPAQKPNQAAKKPRADAVAKPKPSANKPAPGKPAENANEPAPATEGAGQAVAKVPPTPAKITPPPLPAQVKPAPSVAVPQGRVAKAKARGRHWLLLASFVILVVLPSVLAFAYLYTLAEDRFASNAAFSVHKEDGASSMEMLGGLTALGVSGGTTPDADILYQFIQSQRMIEAVDAKVDLRNAYGRTYSTDPVFSLEPDASLEDIVDYWDRIVSLVFEADIGLISMEVTAFSPREAQRISEIILDESAGLINRLSKVSRDDTISQAQQDLDIAAARLKTTRLEMSKFRDVEQIVDPTADIAGQMGVISALQQSLAEAMIRRDLLIGTTRDGDPRIIQAEREITAIRARIEDERTKVGNRDASDAALARVVGEYESLVVDREFAEKSYLAALAAYDAAVADARRKSRYLAVHIEPTLAQTAIYPRRILLGSLVAGFIFLGWALMALTVYSIRDRR